MKREKIEISRPGFCYDAVVGPELMPDAGKLARNAVDGEGCAVIADENSARFFAQRVSESFRSADYEPVVFVIPPGESSKSLSQAESLCTEMAAHGLDRSSLVVGLGGGVVGDLSGFVAAIFLRGIPHIQIPTTLLAMVDSAIGGKTGVNLATGKNLAGAMHHPKLVLADTDALKTLPRRELRQGYAEVVKHGIIREVKMLRDLGELEEVELVRRNIALKAEIVMADPGERSGERALLNFGHTVGHGIERAADFTLPHGDCVSLGIVAACQLSIKRAGFSPAERNEVIALLERFELPTRLPDGIDRGRVCAAIKHDKKFERGGVRFVVTPRLGEAYLTTDVTIADIEGAVAAL